MECEECEEEYDDEESCSVCESTINLCDDCLLTCSECDGYVHDGCIVYFESADVKLCKSCIDEQYERGEKVVEKIVEKVIEVPKETIKIIGFSEPIL